jgi:protease-4
MTPEEQELFQKMLNKVHAEFVQEVARNRRLDLEAVRELSHGFAILGSEAVELGLVDELGSKEDAVRWLEKDLGIAAELYEFEEKKTLLDVLAGVTSRPAFAMGQGIGTVLLRKTATDHVRITT